MKEKIGILTFQNTLNYGAILQSYALYRVLSEEGHDVEVIDYRCPAIEGNEGWSVIPSSPKSLLRYLMKTVKRTAFKGFRSNITYSPKCDKSSIKAIAKRYDCVVVGSDQVWNPFITHEDTNYFLSFEDESARCKSYAASIGLDRFPQDEPYASLLAHFSSLLVREKTARDEIERVAPSARGRVGVVLDPTLLIEKDEWSGLGRLPRDLADTGYVLLYAVSDLHRSGEVASSLAQGMGCRLVQICQRREGKVEGAIHLRNASPEEFLALFEGAAATVVSSFHGVCFSLLFEKDFWATVSGRGASRVTDLLSLLGVPERLVGGGQAAQPSKKVDYGSVTLRLAGLREESLSALKESLTD